MRLGFVSGGVPGIRATLWSLGCPGFTPWSMKTKQKECSTACRMNSFPSQGGGVQEVDGMDTCVRMTDTRRRGCWLSRKEGMLSRVKS